MTCMVWGVDIKINTNELEDRIVERLMERLKPVVMSSRNAGDDELFTVETLAKYLQVSKQWVYERIHLNEIPYIKMKKFPRFRKIEIGKWLDKMKTPAIQPLPNALPKKIKMIKS
jgi:excisionase family DNA binding protein